MTIQTYPIRNKLLQHNGGVPFLPENTIHHVDYRVTDPFNIDLPVGFGLTWLDEATAYFRLVTCDAPYTDWSIDTITILRNAYRTAALQLPQDGHVYYTPENNIFSLSFHHSNWWPFEELPPDTPQHTVPPDNTGTPPKQQYQTTRQHDEIQLQHIYSVDPAGNTHLTLFTDTNDPSLYAHYFAYTTLTDQAIDYSVGAFHAACNHMNHDPATHRGVKLTEHALCDTPLPDGFTPTTHP